MKGKRRGISLLVPVLVLILVLVSMMAACGEEEATVTTAGPTETTPGEETTTTAAGVEDTGQTFDLKFSYHTPSKASMVEAYFEPWAEAVTAATEGRVKITHYAEGSLVKEEQQYDGLLSNTSDIALVCPEFNAGVLKRTEVGSLPGLFPTTEAASDIFWDVLDQYAQDEWSDVKVLGVVVLSGGPYVGNKEVKLPADLEGLRMRSGGKIETWLIEALGGSPVEINLGELPTSMERGLIDGGYLSWSILLSTGIKDVTKYRTEGDLFFRTWVLAMNKDVWESMPATLQEQIMSVSGKENSTKFNLANEEATKGARQAVEGSDKGAGNPPIHMASAEERAQWSAASEPVWAKWVAQLGANEPGQEIIDMITQAAAQYSVE